ncbi:MAG: 3'-5' exonuclease [Bdellovibrionales bacterium]
MRHVMLDFETLSNTPNTAVLSLGAVLFTKDEILTEKYFVFNVQDQLAAKLDVNFDTLVWWMSQGDSAKELFETANKSGRSVKDCLQELSNWLMAGVDYKIDWKLLPWSNGAGFDIPIIENLFARTKVKCPWHFSSSRCYRTIKKIYEIEKDQVFEGTRHHALHDARFQTKCLMNFFKNNPNLER